MKKILLTFLIATILVPQVSFAALTDDLIAYYSLDDATDVHSTFDLTNTGAVPFNTSSCIIDSAADFTPPGDSLNNNTVLGSTSYPRSFSAWVDFDAFGADRTVFSLSDGSIHYYIAKVRDSDDHIVFRSNNNTQAADVDTGVVASINTCYHIVVIQNSATSVDIWVNNTLTNDDAATFVATVGEFYLGYLGRSSVWYHDGVIDEVGIWNRALTSTEVGQLYNGGAGLAYPLVPAEPEVTEDIIWFFF